MERLPALDQPVAWVVVHGHEQAGPYTLEVLIQEVIAGRLAETTPVWWPPMVDWTTIMASEALAAEIERRRSRGAPGWAPLSLTDGSTGQQAGTPSVEPGATNDRGDAGTTAVADVTVVDADVVDLDVVDAEIVETVITGSSAPVVRDDARFGSLVERSTRRAARLGALVALDARFVEEMVAAGGDRGLGFADHHSGSGEHRINLRDVSGDRELTVLLGRVDRGRPDATIEAVLPLNMVLSARGVLSVEEAPNGADGTGAVHGHVSVALDERSGRMTASISLLLGTDDYVDDELVLDPVPLRADLGSVVDALDAALTG